MLLSDAAVARALGRATALRGALALDLGDLPRAAWSMAGYHAIALLGLGKVDDAERQAMEAMRLATESGSLRGLESVHTVGRAR